MRTPTLAILVLALASCGQDAYDKPTQVHVSRVITREGDRVITYSAMYDDGIETYIDIEPHGDPDIVTVERDSLGELTHYERQGRELLTTDTDSGTHATLTPEWESRFRVIARLVDPELVPWSDAHALMTPAELQQLNPTGP